MEHKNKESTVYCVEYGNGNVASPVMQVSASIYVDWGVKMYLKSMFSTER